jgi:hypothetical protein
VAIHSVIARPMPVGWEGRYCHHRGNPAHLGRVLFGAVTGHFAGDVDAARRYFIDDHPAGWSYLGGDFTKPAGFARGIDRFADRRNQCYCHGDRHDPAAPVITEPQAAGFAHYGYVLGDDRLVVLAYRDSGRLEPGAEVPWSARPDWDDLDDRLRLEQHRPLRLWLSW